MESGIYKITNKTNNKFYIGSAVNITDRIINHINRLKVGTHINIHLQRSVNKHGISNFNFEKLEDCSKEELIQREQYYLDTLKPEYNICPIAGSALGRKHSEETKVKISNSTKGRVVSQEVKDKISLSLTGRKNGPRSETTKQKLSIFRKGKCYLSKEQLYNNTLKSLDKTRKKIDLIDNNNNIIKTFVSLAEAGKELNISYKRISMCVTGVRKHTGSMRFKYHTI